MERRRGGRGRSRSRSASRERDRSRSRRKRRSHRSRSRSRGSRHRRVRRSRSQDRRRSLRCRTRSRSRSRSRERNNRRDKRRRYTRSRSRDRQERKRARSRSRDRNRRRDKEARRHEEARTVERSSTTTSNVSDDFSGTLTWWNHTIIFPPPSSIAEFFPTSTYITPTTTQPPNVRKPWRVLRKRIPTIILREGEETWGDRPLPDPASPISFLPEEVMCEILSCLPLRELRLCAFVCSYWRKLSLFVEEHPTPGSRVGMDVAHLHFLIEEEARQRQLATGLPSLFSALNSATKAREEAERARSRRMRKAELLLADGEYFSLASMKVRNPSAYQDALDTDVLLRQMDLCRRFPPLITTSRPSLDGMNELERMLNLILEGEASVGVALFREHERKEKVREGTLERHWGEIDDGLRVEYVGPVYPADDFVYQRAFQRHSEECGYPVANNRLYFRYREKSKTEQFREEVEEEEEEQRQEEKEEDEKEKEGEKKEHEEEEDGLAEYRKMREIEGRYKELFTEALESFVLGRDDRYVDYEDIDDNDKYEPPSPVFDWGWGCPCCCEEDFEVDWNDNMINE